MNLAKKLITCLEEPFFFGGYELVITASIGITLYPIDGEDSETLMSKADTALYRAKEMGKNNFQIYTSFMNIESFKMFQLEKDLRKTIKSEELLLHYQPKVDTKTERLVGAEALIRWHHPEWGLVSPHDYLNESDAEITKSIIQLAHGLHLSVLAEGVETEDQRTFLQQQGCDIIQGYLFYKPVPSKDFQQFLRGPVIIPEQTLPSIPVKERRKVFRIDFPAPLLTNMTLVRVNGKPAKLGTTEVMVENIGRFRTHLRLPASTGILFEFQTDILGEQVRLSGEIVWKHEMNGDSFKYGVKFIFTEPEETYLTKRLNALAIEMRNTPWPSGCRFVQEA